MRALVVALLAGAAIVAVGLQPEPAPRPAPLADLAASTDGARPLVFAHAGAQAYAPGNTREAFALAVEQGADVLEMDLQLTADGQVVTFHDGDVDRTTDGTGAVRDHTLAQLQALDAGYGFTAADGSHPWRGRGVVVPTLDQVLAAFDQPVNLELKPEGGVDLVAPTMAVLDAHRARDRALMASFDDDAMTAFRDAAPDVPTALVEAEVRTLVVRRYLGLHPWWTPPGQLVQVPETHDGLTVVTPGLTRAADRLGLDVHVWTVNERQDMHRLLDAGVHGLMTDRPDVAAEVIAARDEAPAGDASIDPRLEVSRWLQAELPWLTGPLTALTRLGDVEFYLAFVPLLLWSVDRRAGIRFGAVLLLSSGLNAIGKLVWTSPRPLFLDPTLGVVTESSFGIPSGHAQNAVAVWGGLAATLRRWWAWVAALALVGLISLSRLQLGVHLPIDLLVGWAVGGVVLVAVLWAEARLAPWARSRSGWALSAVALAVSLTMVAAAAVLSARLQGWTFPAAWMGAPAEAEVISPATAIRSAGAIVGATVGLCLVRARGGVATAGRGSQHLLRYLLGVGVLGLLWVGLEAVSPGGDGGLAGVLRYLRYAVVALWVTGGAPLLFRRLGLAAADPQAACQATRVQAVEK